jgi:hypothetical protein
MNNYIYEVSGWLKASGNKLLDFLPSGSSLYRVAPVELQHYSTGYVSVAGGSFKSSGESGNWYGTSFDVSIAEKRPSGPTVYEHSCLCQDTPIWNMNKLPEQFLTAIHEDRNLVTGQFLKSQYITECLQTLDVTGNASGIYFPSRRTNGGVIIFNPQLVNLQIVSTGQQLPSGEKFF